MSFNVKDFLDLDKIPTQHVLWICILSACLASFPDELILQLKLSDLKNFVFVGIWLFYGQY